MKTLRRGALTVIILASSLVISLIQSSPTASALTSSEAFTVAINEASKFQIYDVVNDNCGGHTGCWERAGQIKTNVARLAGQSDAYVRDIVRHEVAHNQINAICNTVDPPITAGVHYYAPGVNHQQENFEFVTDAYAVLYNGMSIAHAW